MHPKLFYTVYLGGTQPYHTLGPLNRPLRHSRALQKGPFGPKRPCWGPIGSRRAPGDQIWSQLLPIGLTGLESWLPDTLAWYLASSGPPGPPKGPVLAPIGPFGGPIGSRRAPGDQIWSQLLPIGLTGFKSWLPHTLAWYLASSGPPVDPKGPIWAIHVPYWPQKGLK